MTLEARPGGQTLMTIRHVQLPPGVVDRHRDGWGLIGSQLGPRLAMRR